MKRAYADLTRLECNPPSDIVSLRALEAGSAAAYFRAWREIPLQWKGLNQRPIPESRHRIGSRTSVFKLAGNRNTAHPINAMLNYAYAILESQVRIKSIAEGYDPTLVKRDYSQVQNLLKQANGITYNVKSMNQAFSQRYPVSISSTTSDLQMNASVQQRWQDSLSAFQHALTLGTSTVQNLPNTQAQTASLLASSQSSVGILQATQAGNQLVAVQTRQLADLTALLAAQGRSQALEQAQGGSRGPGSGAAPPLLEHWPGLPAANRPNVPLRPPDGLEHGLARWCGGFAGARAVRRCLRVA